MHSKEVIKKLDIISHICDTRPKKLKQEDCKSEASLVYMVKPCLPTPPKKREAEDVVQLIDCLPLMHKPLLPSLAPRKPSEMACSYHSIIENQKFTTNPSLTQNLKSGHVGEMGEGKGLCRRETDRQRGRERQRNRYRD